MFKKTADYTKNTLKSIKRFIKGTELHLHRQAIDHFIQDKAFQTDLAAMKINIENAGAIQTPGFPNVFCVGVQKTATSFLYSILREHPKVSAFPKDNAALDRLHETNSLNEFESLTKKIGLSKNVRMHFDVGYLFYGESGISTIKNYLCQNPKIIICLRDPVTRLLSEYRMRIRTLKSTKVDFNENEDFFEALELTNKRAQTSPTDYKNHYAYIENSKYANKIESYIDAFGRENIHIIIMENDLKARTRSSIAELFNFLSIFDADAFKISLRNHEQYEKVSRSPKHVNVTLQISNGNYLVNPKSLNEADIKGVSAISIKSDVPDQLNLNIANPPEPLIKSALNLQTRINYTPTADQMNELYECYFRDDVIKLEILLERDLSIWYEKYKQFRQYNVGRVRENETT